MESQQSRRIGLEIKVPPKEPASKQLNGMNPFHEDLPQIPFFVGVIGPRHSGKTVLLFNLLSQEPGWYGSSFKKPNIILFSPTKDKDPTLKSLKLPHVYGPPTDPSWLIGGITEKQKAHMESENGAHVLLVFDDITQLRNVWKPLETLSYLGRHDMIQVLYVSHKMSSIPRGVRTQTQQWILFKPHEESEMDWLLDMFSRRRTRKMWTNCLLRAWGYEDHTFIYVDFEEHDMARIYRATFSFSLFTPMEADTVKGYILYEMDELEQQRQNDIWTAYRNAGGVWPGEAGNVQSLSEYTVQKPEKVDISEGESEEEEKKVSQKRGEKAKNKP